MFCLSHICCYQRRSASKCLSSFSHPDTQCNRPTSMVRLTRRRSPRWAWTSLTYGATSVTSQALTRMVMKSTSMGRGTRRTCWAGCYQDRQSKRRKKPLWSTTTPSPPRLWKSPPLPKYNPCHIVERCRVPHWKYHLKDCAASTHADWSWGKQERIRLCGGVNLNLGF